MTNPPQDLPALPRILIAEDDQRQAEAMVQALYDGGFEVSWVRDVASTLYLSSAHHYDAILLALKLPDGSGLTVLEKLRLADNPVPVILITGEEEVDDRIRGLDLGAVAYLISPIEPKGLVVGISEVISRDKQQHPNQVHYHDLMLDLESHQVELRGMQIQLSVWESSLLAQLISEPGVIHSNDFLERSLRPEIPGFNRPSIETVVRSINYKLGAHLIEHVVAKGWRLSLSP